ncbi:MAG: glucoamylase family protein [Caldilineaceae bacterium]
MTEALVKETGKTEQKGASRLERRAQTCAADYTAQAEPDKHLRLLNRLPKVAELLQAAHRYFIETAEEELALSYAAEWLLDNFHIIEQANRQIKEDLPVGYYRQLPTLTADQLLGGYPRIYALMRDFILFEECQFDRARLQRFVAAFQETQPLTMGELWALPIMLRICLLESLAQAAGRLTKLFRNETAREPGLVFPYTLSDTDIVANCIPSLRKIDSEDWNEFFEDVSLVHQLLCQDPVDIFARMDFPTRDRYRREVEKLARATKQPEIRVAQNALDLANTAYSERCAIQNTLPQPHNKATENHSPWVNLRQERNCHIGNYLLAEGRVLLEKQLGYQPQGQEKMQRWVLEQPTLVYLGSITLITLLILGLMWTYTVRVHGVGALLLLALLLTLLPAVSIAVSLVNWLVTHTLPPRILPKLDFEEGIPAECRTMVVVPALLAHGSDVDGLLGELELHYLRNPDPQLTFAILSDFSDAPQQHMPEDETLLDQARAKVEALNQKYAHQPFYFFHRQRLWNPSQQTWMGWERKRGKLHEFNRRLRGHPDTSYNVQIGKLEVLPQIKYVITLDADTVLPRDAANQLVGTLAHPLNQARFSIGSNKVKRGYTILQPRTAIKPTSANRSLFTRIFGGDTGIDLYTMAVSDVYQDLFGAGIYVGKGIYEVDSFERSLQERIPENTLLSHDLFEGIHGRVGLVSDIVLYEEYPPHYLVNVLRSHRWVRGDWQLLPWLLKLANDQLDGIDHWKIIDNLRRSLLPPALLLLFLAGWTILPGSPLVWTLLGLLTPAFSLITGLITTLIHGLRSPDGVSWSGVLRSLQDRGIRWLLFLAFLPYEALLNLDAIATTLVRLWVTRRHLLEWTTAARTVRIFGDEVTATTTFMKMLPSLVLTAVMALVVIAVRPTALLVALPFIVTWLLAWQIAYWINRPDKQQAIALTGEQERQLRILARHTWLFYDHFVGPDDNWLPPDHFQEAPRGVVAHRTSPTNVGMYLLSLLAAHDLGYVNYTNLALRLRFTFATLNQLERYRGHFLNWIDTQTLAPLPPRYVSTVDSGNLAACLLTLRQGCLALPQQPIWQWTWWQSFVDLLAMLANALGNQQEESEQRKTQLHVYLEETQQRILAARNQPDQWFALLTALFTEGKRELDQHLIEFIEANTATLNTETLRDYRVYADGIHQHLDNMQREIDLLLPWLAFLAQPPEFFTQAPAGTPLAETWQALQNGFALAPALQEVLTLSERGQAQLQRLQVLLRQAPENSDEAQAAREWCSGFTHHLQEAAQAATAFLDRFSDIAAQADAFVEAMEFGFLFDEQRQVFHIGYNVDAGRLDNSYYDLLASEARIASLLAISKHDVPQSHWLHLGRPLTRIENGEEALLSWSGTMFEYLMPPLLLHIYPGTLLYASCYAAVDQQIAYAKQKGVPWGISESGFYTFDAALNYQYRAFGVPGLGFKRGLGEDLVIAPYASLLALPFQPAAVFHNFEQLQRLQAMGRYGLYEALDFTAARLSLGQDHATVRSYMAHHQGMIMLALADYLQGKKMADRFHADPRIESVDLLLQEQIPQAAPLLFPHEDETTMTRPATSTIATHPWPVPTDTPMPLVHFLSNGRYGVLLTNAGGGYSQWKDLALTRWRADTTLDDWGCWLYVQDLANGALWSATRQPVGRWPEHEEVIFHPHIVEFRRRDDAISLHTMITVAPEDDVEIRRISLTNDSDQPRHLQLTSYGEVVLTGAATDRRHQAFAKLFVESEYLPDQKALLFRRRPRAETEATNFLVHLLVFDRSKTETFGPTTYESDRARFLGRGHTPRQPAALMTQTGLSGTTGATLDPIMALSQEINLAPRATVQLTFVTIASQSRQDVLTLARRYQGETVVDRAFVRAHNQAERELRQLDLPTPLLASVQQLLSLLLYPHAARRPEATLLASNRKGQSSLWAFGISGDYPILLMRIRDEAEGELLQDLLQAHTYWRRRGLKIDLVILNQQGTNYGQAVHNFIQRLIERMDSSAFVNQRGGIFVLYEDQVNEADRVLLQTAARVVLSAEHGTLTQQMTDLFQRPTPLPAFAPLVNPQEINDVTPPLPPPTNLQFANGLGGFSADGQEYVVYLPPGASTPAPWINVIANAEFGSLVSEIGAGYTWYGNSGENRLTSWRNDPVSDQPSEVLYLRDEETAELWSPTPQPAPANAPYLVHHGAGYSLFEHHSHNLKQQLRLFVVADAPVKVMQLRLENVSDRPRRMTVTYYGDWVLGVDRESTQQYLVPEFEKECGCLLARNPYSAEFGQCVAFVSASKELHGLTADRTEFLGRLGNLQRPAALERIGLAGRVEAGLDCCAALQIHVDLAPGATEEVFFLVGQGANRDEALNLVRRFQQPDAVTTAWATSEKLWHDILDTVTVTTPDQGMNLLLNRWLLYQALSCRIWGRSALYQSSGAFGFRDQLQDVMALIHARPDLTRQQILESARHQFDAGDVLHWWHPPGGRGVRTRMSDDLLWLPYVTAHYVAATGDWSILDEQVPFLLGEPLREDEDERYSQYSASETAYTLYEHCQRALRKGTTAGAHGIPLMGAGDWNDGMNRVGIQGKGESIWLGWFLHKTLVDFAALTAQMGNTDQEKAAKQQQAETYRQQAERIRQALEENGWDGKWYLRAYYDDGAPLGSAQNRECQIDSIAQSWGVLSGAAEPTRAKAAMQAVLKRLVKQEGQLILLFTPPFDKTSKDPGYIKGYLPGIRENGGQYTHAALWSIWAFAELGDGQQAEALFRLINPIYRSDTPTKLDVYKVEPYVISADVYGVQPHVGRGGWTWYTGSAGWMYRLGIEAILGIRRQGDQLEINPCIPPQWPKFALTYRFGNTHYQVRVENPEGVSRGVKQVKVDGAELQTKAIQLHDDGQAHEVEILLG